MHVAEVIFYVVALACIGVAFVRENRRHARVMADLERQRAELDAAYEESKARMERLHAITAEPDPFVRARLIREEIDRRARR